MVHSNPAIERTMRSWMSTDSEVEMPFRIYRASRQPFGLKKNLVPVPVAETADLVFNRWTIAGSLPRNGTARQWRAWERGTNDVVSMRVCPGNSAEYLFLTSPSERRHCPWLGVAELNFKPAPVDCSTVDSRRGSCLEAPHGQIQRTQAVCKEGSRRFAHATTGS